MTVKELIERLNGVPQDAEIVTQHWLTGQFVSTSDVKCHIVDEDLETGDTVERCWVEILAPENTCKYGQTVNWQSFSDDVHQHITDYVIPQYGDVPNDLVSTYKADDMKLMLSRYIGRVGTGQRGKKEALRDCLKIAHYAQRLYDTLRKELEGE